MKKLLLLFAFLTLSVGLWAETQTVPYRYPVYNIDGDATSGVKEWKDGSAEAIRITGSESVLGKAGTETWYYVDCLEFTEIKTDSISITIKNGLDIKGTVHLILCDMPSDRQILTIGTPNTNRPGINTEGATLVIYGQTAGSGKLAVYGGEGDSGDDYNGSPGIGSCPTTSDDDIPAPGGTVIINGGFVMATGGNGGAGIGGAGSTDGTGGMGGTVIINGGTVEATGMYGAGIGGGRHGSGGTVTINGGTVTAKSHNFGAGIGGGSSTTTGDPISGGTVTINGGTVTALGAGLYSSGIGAGGRNGIGAKLTIKGGTVTAQGGNGTGNIMSVDIGGQGIDENEWAFTTITGGALKFAGDSIKDNTIVTRVAISGGIFSHKPKAGWLMDSCRVIQNEDTTTNDEFPWAIERDGTWQTVTYGENITASPTFTSGTELPSGTHITFTAADRTASGYDFIGFYKESTFATPITTGVSGQTYTVTVTDADISVYAKYKDNRVSTTYIDENGVSHNIKALVVANADKVPVTWGETGKTSWYLVKDKTVSLTGGVICQGDVNLILADGAKLTVNGVEYQAGIQVSGDGNSLTIYGQSAQSGQLIANGGKYSAGIGGGEGANGSNITINGGMVTAHDGGAASGIGGGRGGTGSNIKVSLYLVIKADGSNPPTTLIKNNGGDLAKSLAEKPNVTINPTPYIDENGETQIARAQVVPDSSTTVTLGAAGTETWYVVPCGISIRNGLDIKGTVHLILCDMNEEGEELTVGKPNTNRPGINTEGATLVIYGQTAGSGKLAAYGGEGGTDDYDGSAGIGGGPRTSGGTVIINGGTVTAMGGTGGAGIGGGGDTEGTGGTGGTVIINRGTVTATGMYGAGIGGGRQASGGTVIINGGTVKAKSKFGAGIGGGSSVSYGDLVYGGTVTINGGTVTALGEGRASSGIGAGGKNGIGAKLTINGGTVTAQGCYPYGGYESVDIGGPYSTTNASTDVMTTVTGGALNASVIVDKVAISGGIFAQKPQDEWLMGGCSVISNEDAATKDEFPWAIERDETWKTVTYGENITVSPTFISGTELPSGTKITFTAADRTADGYDFIGFYKESTFATPITTGVSGQTYTVTVTVTDSPISVYAKYKNNRVSTTYIDEKGESHNVEANETGGKTNDPVTWGETGKTTWYVVKSKDARLLGGVVCQGDVNLILADGANLIANLSSNKNKAGIQVSGDGNSLTIYGQAKQTGTLKAYGGENAAGIGGTMKGNGSNITINGGIVGVSGGKYAAGIGGGAGSSGSNITINGGKVTAYGDMYGAGIGGGNINPGSNITITGGTVTAYGGQYAAGIGGGYHGHGSNISITGGTVTANGGEDADGIGNGNAPMKVSSNITVGATHIVKAGDSENPTDVIENTGADLAGSLAGKQYVTVTKGIFNITANQDPDDKTHYYSTFYSSTNAYKVPEDVTAYTGTVDGDVLKLTSIADGIIPADEAVILRLTTEDNTATKQQFALTATTTTATKSTNNALTGTDVAIEELGANDYALSLGQNGVGFYLWDGMTISAHKAYLTLTDPSIKALIFQFEDDSTTGIATPSNSPEEMTPSNSPEGGEPVAYDVTGVRVGNNYKGIVIKNGKKVIR